MNETICVSLLRPLWMYATTAGENLDCSLNISYFRHMSYLNEALDVEMNNLSGEIDAYTQWHTNSIATPERKLKTNLSSSSTWVVFRGAKNDDKGDSSSPQRQPDLRLTYAKVMLGIRWGGCHVYMRLELTSIFIQRCLWLVLACRLLQVECACDWVHSYIDHL